MINTCAYFLNVREKQAVSWTSWSSSFSFSSSPLLLRMMRSWNLRRNRETSNLKMKKSFQSLGEGGWGWVDKHRGV